MTFDPVTARVVLDKIQLALTAVANLSIEDLQGAVYEVDRFDALAPFLDATLYLSRREDNTVFGHVTRALLECRKTIDPYAHRYVQEDK